MPTSSERRTSYRYEGPASKLPSWLHRFTDPSHEKIHQRIKEVRHGSDSNHRRHKHAGERGSVSYKYTFSKKSDKGYSEKYVEESRRKRGRGHSRDHHDGKGKRHNDHNPSETINGRHHHDHHHHRHHHHHRDNPSPQRTLTDRSRSHSARPHQSRRQPRDRSQGSVPPQSSHGSHSAVSWPDVEAWNGLRQFRGPRFETITESTGGDSRHSSGRPRSRAGRH